MKKITGDDKSVHELLAGRKYAIDYYQREYNWEKKQVSELIGDLVEKFYSNYHDTHARRKVADYDNYFLGSIIISERDGKRFIVDGQQRLTTLTLFLIYVNNLQKRGEFSDENKVDVGEMIYSKEYGERSFNMEVTERQACMEGLFKNGTYEADDQSPSVQNLVARYEDFDTLFPENLQDEGSLPFFVDWLIKKVLLVEIITSSEADAYTVFETMNDRGLSLTPTEMLKGYLLSRIDEHGRRDRAHNVWKSGIHAATELGKGEDADFLKAWLRSQYAVSIRERGRGAQPKDFERIGTEFHRWVRDHFDGLREHRDRSGNALRFIEHDFKFYAGAYVKARKAGERITSDSGLESVYYNAQLNFTLQYPLLLAPLDLSDDDSTTARKMRIVADYIDILITRRIWNFRAIDYSTMQYAMFSTVPEIRGLDADSLAAKLAQRLEKMIETENLAFGEEFHLHGGNRKQVHQLLARMTEYAEVQSGEPSRCSEYLKRGRKGCEIEHIWANHFERHADEFDHRQDFESYRNRIGGLLLLPKSTNASYGDLPYEKKREHYLKENLLAASLHEKCYERNPGFSKFVENSQLPFKAYPKFAKAELDARQTLYRQIAERIWGVNRLKDG